ncbi:hypothetical protein [Amycolatopsis sp. lyj-23]|uniref:hypothetical protein n=1 Tax=Amycolatopsis sp. lyj-23 TaxID=2789283 RepID=UPI003978BBC7
MERPNDITDEQVAAARLRRVIDDRLERATPDVVRWLAAGGTRMEHRAVLALIDELVTTPARGPRRILVVEGLPGSGRSTLLRDALNHWSAVTPAALVPAGDAVDVEAIVVAAMLAFSNRVAFPRTLLALVAMTSNLAAADATTARQVTRELVATFQDIRAFSEIVKTLVVAAGVAEPTASRISEGLVGKQRYSFGFKAARRAALDWFGLQDRGLGIPPEEVLLRLNAQAAAHDPAARREALDVLVSALLADLRAGQARSRRRTNCLLLLDDADSRAAGMFLQALARVRADLAALPDGPADPLIVVASGGGPLSRWLAAEDGWFRTSLADLSLRDVELLVARRTGDAAIATRTVSSAVYRLTHGHPGATEFVLRRLADEPDLVRDFDRLLASPSLESDDPVDRHLLRRFCGFGGPALDELITISAAGDRQEATGLIVDPGVGRDLFTSPLWGDDQRLHPMIRYLGLRALAARTDPDRTWDTVFARLAETGDRGQRLRSLRLLGHIDAVTEEMATLFGELSGDEWGGLFDTVVDAPDPRGPLPQPGPTDDQLAREVFALLSLTPPLTRDPRFSDPDVLRQMSSRISHAWQSLATRSPDPVWALDRARETNVRGRL